MDTPSRKKMLIPMTMKIRKLMKVLMMIITMNRRSEEGSGDRVKTLRMRILVRSR